MKKFALLTQDQCRNCDQLKLLLQKPMKGKYDDRIEIVHRQSDESHFSALVEKYNIRATPTLVNLETGDTWTDISSGPRIARFLES